MAFEKGWLERLELAFFLILKSYFCLKIYRFMVAIAEKERLLSIEEYLDMEAVSHEKHHFSNGKRFKMAGATVKHNVISSNIIAALHQAIRQADLPFIVSSSDTKIWVPKINSFYYPDAVVIYEKPEFYEGRHDTILNPLVIFEVMSPKSEKNDQGNKFMDYATLPSLRDYLAVSQDRPYTRISTREADDLWRMREADGIGAVVSLPSLGIEVKLDDFYYKTEGL